MTSIKTNNTVILLASIIFCTYFSCSNKESKPQESFEAPKERPNGERLYTLNCSACHGENGKAMLAGAKDLSISALELKDRIAIITNGRGAMQPYKNILTTQEIEAVSVYIESFQTKQ
jgi:mono/diheme cytochrome c family protein